MNINPKFLITIGIALLLGTIFVAIISDKTVAITDLTKVTDSVDISSARLFTEATTKINNETLNAVSNSTGRNFAVSGYNNVVCTVVTVTNFSSGDIVTSAYWTATNCNLKTKVVRSTNATVNNETLTAVDKTTGVDLAVNAKKDVKCYITAVTNASSGAAVFSGNWTATNCNVKTLAGTEYEDNDLNVTYIYHYISDYEDQKLNVTYTYTYRTKDGAINTTYPIVISKATYNGNYPECKVTTIELTNQSGATMAATTDYVFTDTTAVLTLNDVVSLNSSTSNSTTATYDYCGENYVGGWARNVTRLVPGFYVLAILAAGIFLAYLLLKED